MLPMPEADDALLKERVLGEKVEDWERAPQITSLQKALVEHVRAGEHWNIRAGFLLRQHLGAPVDVYHREGPA